ncbi:MAG: GntR family transcriptional regulator [Solirubrobacterales bacterium]|nr:GntR family transcriptional regulator [Solirubrobacterales bacterium]MBV9166320.1 GntR family transcriptional regulator [Solirubrobacterales bacterium]MBV9535519.1 GntR family transcriptional regulator [Solirubrobacterales bacterium]
MSARRQPGTRLEIASVVDQVYAAIRERIADGSLPRGARVHQEGLAEELGVSRTPVREALRRLAAEGLVQMRTNRGAKVLDIDRGGMRAAYEARLVIEPGAARLAAKHSNSEAQERMAAALAAQRQALRSVARSFEANRAFHLALVAASGNEFLVRFAEQLWVARIGAAIYERQLKVQERLLLDISEHEQILTAVRTGDGRRAESLTRSHLVEAMRLSTDILADGEDG